MTDQTTAELIAQFRREGNEWSGKYGRLFFQAADAVEAAEARAEEAERERDRLDEAFDRDLPWRYDEVEAQRNQYAAAVEKVRAEERERCALIAESVSRFEPDGYGGARRLTAKEAREHIIRALRAYAEEAGQ